MANCERSGSYFQCTSAYTCETRPVVGRLCGGVLEDFALLFKPTISTVGLHFRMPGGFKAAWVYEAKCEQPSLIANRGESNCEQSKRAIVLTVGLKTTGLTF